MTKRKQATLENLLRQWQTMGPMGLSPAEHAQLDKSVQEKCMSETETVTDPYRTDPREARIKELEEDLESKQHWYDGRMQSYESQIREIRANYDRQIAGLNGSSAVRGFGKLMLAAFTILWLLVNSAGLVLPVYLVLEFHKDMSWLHFMWLSILSWIFFYFHISSLSEKS